MNSPSEPEVGDLVEEFELGCVKVRVTRSCIRRDVYDLRAPFPLPESLRERLAEGGAVRGGGALYVVEVPGVHSITVASKTGRLVVMPRMAAKRVSQRQAALLVAREVEAAVVAASTGV